jgi:hypothetical protein
LFESVAFASDADTDAAQIGELAAASGNPIGASRLLVLKVTLNHIGLAPDLARQSHFWRTPALNVLRFRCHADPVVRPKCHPDFMELPVP